MAGAQARSYYVTAILLEAMRTCCKKLCIILYGFKHTTIGG